ncbi:hypothetical protein [Rhodococcus sp. ARC_M6]|uniref:hypothetical protein n=1 Tax=Rhodococcus sp. ARC_M6 TaxID=2928852 RepID=UPI001FB307D4|nr:hypothetical protein [Rhodococcus sp. ARC_M6]MCJ0906812.1 hypothetical protein [Rhodococcus sp. ARC_M6]
MDQSGKCVVIGCEDDCLDRDFAVAGARCVDALRFLGSAFEDIVQEASENATALPDKSSIKIMLAAPTEVVMDAVIGSEPMDEKGVRRFNACWDSEGMLATMPSLPASFRTNFPDFFDADGKVEAIS